MIQLRGLDAAIRPYAEYTFALGRALGLNPQVTSTYRSWAEQQQLYSRYLSGDSKYPANPPGLSAHQYGLAFDSVVPAGQQADWDEVRAYVGWKLYSNDKVHAEVPNWMQYVPNLR